MRVLISRPDKIGDVVLALHGIKQLKELKPDWKVFLHASPYTRSLVTAVNFLDGVITSDEELANQHFDVAVDLMAKSATARLFVRSNIKRRLGNSARWFSFLYHKTSYVRRSKALLNEAEYNWKLISLLDDSFSHSPLKTSLKPTDFNRIPDNGLRDHVVLMPGVAVSAQQWSLDEWLSLAKLLIDDENTCVFILGPAEASLVGQISTFCENCNATYTNTDQQKKIAHLIQPESILHAVGALQHAKQYVGPSTGMTHLASCCGVPGIALYPETQSMHPRRWLPFQSSLTAVSLTRKPRAKDIYNYLLGQGDPRLNPLARTEVSAFVVCKNEERNIRRCLSSLAWCDEIVLVDSGSTDKTLDIAREFTDKIYFREWTGHSEQKQFALEKCTKEWVLNIDADEEVSPELRGHIEQVLSRPDDTRRRVSGYEVNRLVYFLNKWWEHGGWYPEYRLRFFQREKARWGGVNPHEKAVVRGRVRRIHGHLHHFTYQDIPHQIRSLNDHSTLSARCLHQEGVKVHLWNILLNPPFRFVKFYILKRGFREGFPGFMVAFIEAMYTFLKYVKLWELQRLGSGQSVQSSYRSAHRYEQASQGVK